MSITRPHKYQKAEAAALHFLHRSISACHGEGSAAYFARWRHPFRGWSPAYPETTGYLIPTLMAYQKQQTWIKEALPKLVDWLLKKQFHSGAFPALFGNTSQASLFNTGMILIGLSSWHHKQPSTELEKAIHKACTWMESQFRKDLMWEESGSPTYYTRALWGLALGWKAIHKDYPHLEENLQAYQKRRIEKAYQKWGFEGKQEAFTHTLAYTLRGFWECGLLLNSSSALEEVSDTLSWIEQTEALPLAGQYSHHWKENHRFRCLPGEAQLSLLFLKVGNHQQKSQMISFGMQLLDQLLETQVHAPGQSKHGGIAGSHPVWGPYMRGKYPNWGAKFLLDALREAQQTEID